MICARCWARAVSYDDMDDCTELVACKPTNISISISNTSHILNAVFLDLNLNKRR